MTCVSLRRNPEGSLGVGFRDTWRTPKESEGVSRCGLSGHVAYSEGIRRVFSWFGHSGHVAYSEGFRRVSFGLGTRDMWRTWKASGRFLLVWALGTRGVLGGCP